MSQSFLNLFSLYRLKAKQTLIYLLITSLLGLSICLSIFAEDTSGFDNIPDDLPPIPSLKPSTQEDASSPFRKSIPPPPPKKSRWPFHKKASNPKRTPESIINVGPHEAPPASDPLFRLPMPIRINNTHLDPGFYLAKINPLSAQSCELLIYRENKLISSLSLLIAGEEPQNGPAEKRETKHPNPKIVQINSQTTSDHQHLIFILQDGDNRFESEPIPLEIDRRPQLDF